MHRGCPYTKATPVTDPLLLAHSVHIKDAQPCHNEERCSLSKKGNSPVATCHDQTGFGNAHPIRGAGGHHVLGDEQRTSMLVLCH